jgi:hypothetical protein
MSAVQQSDVDDAPAPQGDPASDDAAGGDGPNREEGKGVRPFVASPPAANPPDGQQ